MIYLLSFALFTFFIFQEVVMGEAIVLIILALIGVKIFDGLFTTHDTKRTSIKHPDGEKTEIEFKIPRK